MLSSWIAWIRLWLQTAKVILLVNDIQGREIARKRGLGQGNRLSSLIFVLVAEGLQYMIARCRGEGLLEGLGCRDDTNMVIILHDAHDTLIFGKSTTDNGA